MKNSFGHLFKLHTFGESHGVALGALIDGMPSGVVYRGDILISELQRRRPGKWDFTFNVGTSSRKEPDIPELLSGVYQGYCIGTPIAVLVRNQDQHSDDYANLSPRAGHADQVWLDKFEKVDLRGGGRSSGRETLSRVIGGAFAKMLLLELAPQLRISAFSKKIGPFELTAEELGQAASQDCDHFIARFPSLNRQEELKKALLDIQSQGESWGGVAKILIHNVPKGLGQPVFHKLKNDLASAFMSIGAVHSCEIGDLNNPSFEGSQFHSQMSSYGGIQGGISNGETIEAMVGFKPTSSILDVAKKGRHDPCIVTRAIPVLEAMTALVLADHLLWTRLDNLNLRT